MTADTMPKPARDAAEITGDPIETASAHVAERALTPTTTRRVGLELELHLVDLAAPVRRPAWQRVEELTAALPPMPEGSTVTFEPGGQIELSTPPHDDVVASVAALRADLAVLRTSLAEHGYGGAGLGCDPARELRRVNPGERYAAMERHFAAVGCPEPGRAMMTATAALQVNLDAGPASGWRDRMELVGSMVPMLVAASATSPYLAGRTSGWHSMRQQIWDGIDHFRSEPVPPGEPGERWARYALDAPVMVLRTADGLGPVDGVVSFRDWLAEPTRLGRPATLEDLDYHLTTLFPPVRPRGYVEIRCLDALPDRWWPAVAALVTTLVEDPAAAQRAAELCEPVAGGWETAARHGLDDQGIRAAVLGCARVAAERAPDGLKPEVEALVELYESGDSPSGWVRRRIDEVGPAAVLEETAREEVCRG